MQGRWPRWTLLLLLAGSLASSCTCGRRGSVGSGRGSAVVVVDPEELGRPEAVLEKEPNDTRDQAPELSAEQGGAGTLGPGDQDWYRITLAAPPPIAGEPGQPPPITPPASRPLGLPAQPGATSRPPGPPGQVLSVTLTGVAEADLVLEVWNEKQRLILIDNSGVGEGEVLVNLWVAPGTVYLLVREARRLPAGRYRLSYSRRAAEEGEEREPNWKASLASALPIEGEAVGYLGWKRDNDWYRIDVGTLPAGGRLRVEYDGLDEVRANLSVRAGSTLVQERWGAPGEGITLANLAINPGQPDLFLVVRTHNHFNVESRYSVRVIASVPPGPTEAEPNDTPAAATPLSPAQPLLGLLGDTQDRDLYSVRVSQAGVLRVEVIPPLNLDAALAVLDEAGKVVWEVDAGPAREPEVLPALGVRPPRVLLQVRAPRSSSLSPVAPYQIKVGVPEGEHEREPNGESTSSTGWAAEAEQILGTIHPRGDVDWYRIGLPAPGTPGEPGPGGIRVEAGKLKLRLELSRLDGTPAGSASTDSTGVARLALPADAGAELLLKVTELGNGANPREPYRLSREKP